MTMTDPLTDIYFPGLPDQLGKLTLTGDNYFSTQADTAYMSASQLKRFMECEALALAELRGDYVREETTALLVGGYVDAYFSRTLDQFVANNPQIFTNKGDLRADFKQAQDIIAYIEQDPLMMAMLQGDLQRVVTGDILGVPFKGKLDVLLDATQCRRIAQDFPDMAEHLLMADGAICDLKILRDLMPVYRPGQGRMSFVSAWNYPLQLALYQNLLGKNYPCFLLIATKEKAPDKMIVHIPSYMLASALDSVEELIPRYAAIKRGEIEPVRCGVCDFCKSNKKLFSAVDADDLEGAGLL